MDRRALVLPKAIRIICDDLEANVTALPLNMARWRQEQAVRVDNLVSAGTGVERRRTTVPLRQVRESLGNILCDRSGTIVLPTWHGASMVYGLEDLMAALHWVGDRVSQGDSINHQTRPAHAGAIEAARAALARRIASHAMIVSGAVTVNARRETRSRTRMRVETSVNAGVFEAKLIDQMMFSDHRAFRALLKEISQSGAKKCVFNLSGLTSIDSSGLGMFMVALDEAKKGRWTLTIKSPQGHVRSLLVLSRFDKLLNIEG
jgi:anti-anti-sigma factor